MKSKKILTFSSIILLSLATLTACDTGQEESAVSDSQPAVEESVDTAAGDTTEESTEESTEDTAEESSETSGETEADLAASQDGTVVVEDLHGTVEVPVNPSTVVALDNRSFETLAEWGIELAAVPKSVMPEDSLYVQDEDVADIGNHREPDLELIAAVQPELVIVGQRFAPYYEDIKALVPDAVVVDFTFDVSEEADQPGANLVNGLKHTNTELGKIFEKEAEADQLIQDFDAAMADAQAAYNGEDTIMSVIVSGGDIGFSAPSSGRVWGPLYEIFDWQPALDVDEATSDHQGDEISVEAIAQSQPDWLMVLDRDAGITAEDGATAQDVIENAPALSQTPAIQNGQVVYAPNDTYTNESIQTYTELFQILAQAFE